MESGNPLKSPRVARPEAAPIGLRPSVGRHGWSRRAARLRVPRAWSRALQIRFIAALLKSDGLDRACAEVNVTLAEALGERLRDRHFRSEWFAADAERLETAETRYIDHLLGVLADPAGKALPTLQDKGLLAVWQALRDGRKRAGGGTSAADAPIPAPAPVDDQAMIDALIAQVAAGLAEAEAELGLPGVQP